MGLKKKINRHKEMAEQAMVSNPNTRNSDWTLLFEVLEQKGINLSKQLRINIVMSGINIHTLVRERRKIQSTGSFLPTDPEVLKRRRLLAADYAEHYGE